jgi:integrase
MPAAFCCNSATVIAGGLDIASFSAHSLRAGFITSAAEAGASVWKISEVSRHASFDVLRGYIRSVL